MQHPQEMPTTLTLEDRAALVLNALIGVADEDYNCIPFFSGHFKDRPAWMSHGNWDFGSSHGRLVNAVILARIMSGSDYGEDIEKQYRENLLSFFREDGLSYRRSTFTEDTIREHQAAFRESASMIDQRSVLMGLTTWYATTGDERAYEAAVRHCAALKRIARKERESWYYPASEYTETGWPSFDAVHTRLAVDPAAMWGRQIMGFVRFHKLTGNTDALELAENFAANIIYRSGVFNKDGSFNGALEYRNGHFHTRMGTLGALARFADFTDDAAIMQWVKDRYDWGLTQCTTFGWTPGDMHTQAYEHETCTLVDAVDTGITLARHGHVQYWGIVERFLRNHLTEAQMQSADWIDQRDDKSLDIPQHKTFYRVGDRLVGAFAGYAAPNDFVYDGPYGRGHIMDVQTCCLGAGTRGLFIAWNHIVTEQRGRVSVNFLLNRATEWLDIASWLPHHGRVELTVHKDIPDLWCRIPEWVPFGAVQLERHRGGNVSAATGRDVSWWKDTFIKLGPASAGERVTISFPVRERETRETAVDLEYQVQWRGDDVVGIAPAGTYYPLYANRAVLTDVPMRERDLRRVREERLL